jgi:outer membrane protein assembly factor BamB
MHYPRIILLLAGTIGSGLLCFSDLPAADWPRWRGPHLDARSTETGLLQEWPEEGPPLLWKTEGLGTGFSSVAIAGGRLYTMGDLPGDGGAKEQRVLCLDLATQKRLWTAKVGPPHGDGSRCTPTVEEGRVYGLGTDGDLVALEADSGKLVWRKSLVRDFGGKMMSGWKFSESPLVDGEKLVCTPGGKEAVVVALNKQTGEVIWKAPLPVLKGDGKEGAGYSSAVISEACGVRQYVQLVGRGIIGIAAKDGQPLWGYERVVNGVANIPTPIVDGDFVFCSTAYGRGAALLKLVPGGDSGVQAKEVYFVGDSVFQNHHGGVVHLDKYIYGGHGQNQGEPVCLEMSTGKVVWRQRPSPGGGSAAVLYADGRLIFRYEKGEVCLLEATPEAFRLKGKFTPPKERGMSGPAWAHPVIVDGRLYLRHNDVLLCYDVKKH